MTNERVPSLNSLGRREWLSHWGTGLGTIAFADILLRDQLLHSTALGDDDLPQKPATPIPVRAKRIIWLFMSGGPSQIDTFDPKPDLAKFEGKSYAGDEKRLGTPGRPVGLLTPSPMRFDKRGESGLPISEIFPCLAESMDDLCIIRSMTTDSASHGSACLQANLGTGRIGSPSIGSWFSYGLGRTSDSFPSFVVMHDPRGGPNSGSANWSPGYLPSIHQGTVLRCGGEPLADLTNPAGVSPAGQRRLIDLVSRLNMRHAEERGLDPELVGRVHAYESAFRLQREAADLVDLGTETKETIQRYGIDELPTDTFGRQCLIARRLLERGVRFVQIYSGAASTTNSWDGHFDCVANHRQRALETDRPIAGLIADLKRTGLWEETLLVWMGEFGRTPTADSIAKQGRDHNQHGFSAWVAGAGIKGGQVIGATDELGLYAVESPRHVTDLLATLLLHVGIDPDRLRRDRVGGQLNLFGREVRPIVDIWS